ncbi:MAG: mannitol dehydrogenase family protein [Pseudomonadota bacterium]
MPRILHLGVGNFFRAHQAWYTQHCPGWTITGVSFRSPAIRDGLVAQDYDYALVIKGAAGTRIERITCIDDILVAPEAPMDVVAAIASDSFDVITLTVTEKAYHLRSDGTLELNDPAIRTDLAGGAMTVIGYLARGLAARQAPVTVLSCDNLPENGRKLAHAVQGFCSAAGLATKAWATFPSSMVDRITPATTDAIRAEARDPMAVPTETFTEWVVEDDFAAARPDWPGVQWVGDVAPHEMRKLRMLNGAHSYLAYAGTQAGHSFVHQAIADPHLRTTARALMQEAAETLPDAVRSQTETYVTALLDRFANPALEHRLRQIAMDGSKKLPIRILATLQDRQGQASPALQSAVFAWVDFVRAEVAAGRPLDDPRRDDLIAACHSDNPDAALCALIGMA